jgi:hypothetical protein
MTMRALLTASILLVLAASASAATLKLKDGSTVTGKALRYDSPTQTLYFHTDAGKDVQYTLAELDSRSVYLINASLVPKDDAKKQLQVANFARDIGLYAHAVRRYGETLKTDPSLKDTVDAEMAKLKRMAAETCKKNAQAAAGKGDMREAEKWLTILIDKLPDEPEAAEARTALDDYYAKNRAKKIADADAKSSDALKKDLENGKARYQKMVEKCTQALQTKASGASENLLRSAISDGQWLLKEIDNIQKKHDVAQVRENADRYRGIVTDQMIEAYLHIASQKTVQSDYKGALNVVNEALALDPKNQEALSARARIEDYSSRGIRGW